jgi:hypothetical protein
MTPRFLAHFGLAFALLAAPLVAQPSLTDSAAKAALLGKLLQQKGPPADATTPAPSAAQGAPYRFRPSGERLRLDTYVDGSVADPKLNAVFKDALRQFYDLFDAEVAKENKDGDLAAAFTYGLAVCYALCDGKTSDQLDDATGEAVYAQIASVLDDPALRRLSDRQKQDLHEAILLPTFALQLMQQFAIELGNKDAEAAIPAQAGVLLEALLQGDPARFRLTQQGLQLVTSPSDAPTGSATVAAPRSSATPTAASAGAGVSFTAPPGWTRQEADGAVLFQTSLSTPANYGRHAASLLILPPRPAPQGIAVAWESSWRELLRDFQLGDSVARYATRLSSGLVLHYFGRFMGRADGSLHFTPYVALYLVELGERVQPIIVTLIPNQDQQYVYPSAVSNDAYSAAFPALNAFVQSLQPPAGFTPRAGAIFSRADLEGRWGLSDGVFGGFYVNTDTGASAGAAYVTSGGRLALNRDNTYDYTFAYASNQPGFGSQHGQSRHSGRFSLRGDVIVLDPGKKLENATLEWCVVGVGSAQTPKGPRRLLIVVAPNDAKGFLAPSTMPVGSNYSGVMNWYVEE